MSFKEYIMREMTSTGDIANFSRISIPLVTRTWVPEIAFEMEPTANYPKKKKNPYMQPQVKE